jgi:hypothetical protein
MKTSTLISLGILAAIAQGLAVAWLVGLAYKFAKYQGWLR